MCNRRIWVSFRTYYFINGSVICLVMCNLLLSKLSRRHVAVNIPYVNMLKILYTSFFHPYEENQCPVTLNRHVSTCWPNFHCNPACVYLADLCVSVCVCLSWSHLWSQTEKSRWLEQNNPERSLIHRPKAYSRVQQILSRKYGQRIWNPVKPSAEKEEKEA